MNFTVLCWQAGKIHSLLIQLRKERGSEFAAEKAVLKGAY